MIDLDHTLQAVVILSLVVLVAMLMVLAAVVVLNAHATANLVLIIKAWKRPSAQRYS